LCVYTVNCKCVAAGIADRYYSTDITNTYLHNPWSRVLLENLIGIQFVNTFPAFYGPRRLITAFTSAFVCVFRNKIRFYGEELLAPRPNPKLEDHPLSVTRDWLFNTFAATLHTGGRSSIRNLRTRHAVVTGTHLTPDITSKGKGKVIPLQVRCGPEGG